MLPSNHTDAFYEDPERLRFAIQASGVGIWEVNLASNMLLWDQRCCELFGLTSPAPLTYEQAVQYIHPDDQSKVFQAMAAAIRGVDDGKYDAQYRTIGVTDGKLRWVRFSGKVFFDDAGKALRMGGIAQEITDVVAAAEKMIEAQSLAEVALSGSNAGSFRIRLEDDHMEYSPAFARILTGNDQAILTRQDFIHRVYPEDRPGRLAAYKEAAKTGKLFYEARVTWYDQSVHWMQVTGTYLSDPAGKPTLFTGILRETTDIKEREQALRDSGGKFRSLIEQAPVATCLFVGPEMMIEVANSIMIDYWGKGPGVIGKKLIDILPELDGQPYLKILDRIYITGIPHSDRAAATDIEVDGEIHTFYFDFTYKPIRNAAGEVYAIMNMAIDVTEQVIARKKLEESEAKLRSVIANAPAAMGLFVGRDLIVEMPNKAFVDIVGKGSDIAGKPLREVMPELDNQPFLQILDDVFTSGKMFQSFGAQVDIVQQGVMTHNFYNITYSPLFDADGKVYAILDIAIDVTERVEAEQQIERSRMELLTSFEQSPVGIAIISKENLVFRMANSFYAALVGRKPEQIIGKPLLIAVPELVGQGFEQQLQEVMDTGIPFIAKEQAVQIIRNNMLETLYTDFTYQPQRDLNQNITGILVVVTDVTAQYLSRRKIEEAEADLRNAIEIAELATWTVDAATGVIAYDARMKDWVGLKKAEQDFEEGMNPIPEEDRERIRVALEKALDPQSDGIYDEEHFIEHCVTGRRRVIHAQATRYLDEAGKPLKLVGTAKDITMQRELQTALEQEVQERTEELATSNEELQAINEELADTNERLVHSNEELAQYAYVASHDLQEPLRKIRMFSGMLAIKEGLTADSNQLVAKIVQSSERMSLLIRDLLEFSRLLKSESLVRPVDLNEVATAVINDFELTITEKSANIILGKLPVIEAVGLQMNQLFYNLIANALKFGKAGVQPKIEIRSEVISRQELTTYINRVLPFATYHHITVSDNGIGFDTTYSEKIFEVFQRLHGRDIYPGSGIGLALCRRIVGNHNGVLFATSTPGEGSVFHLIMPNVQAEAPSTGN